MNRKASCDTGYLYLHSDLQEIVYDESHDKSHDKSHDESHDKSHDQSHDEVDYWRHKAHIVYVPYQLQITHDHLGTVVYTNSVMLKNLSTHDIETEYAFTQ